MDWFIKGCRLPTDSSVGLLFGKKDSSTSTNHNLQIVNYYIISIVQIIFYNMSLQMPLIHQTRQEMINDDMKKLKQK